VEGVLAGAAALVGQLTVGADDGVADGALGLALEGADHVTPVREEAVDQGAVLSPASQVSGCGWTDHSKDGGWFSSCRSGRAL